MNSSPHAILHEALLCTRKGLWLIADAHLETQCDEWLNQIFKSCLGHVGHGAALTRDLENYLRNRFSGNFEAFCTSNFEKIRVVEPSNKTTTKQKEHTT